MTTLLLRPIIVWFVCSFFAPALQADDASNDQGQEPETETLDTGQVQVIAGQGRTDPYVDERFKKSVPLFGSDWRFSFGGYAKVDLIGDFSGTGNKNQFELATIPVDDDPPPGSYSNLQIRETRFNFEVRNFGSKYANDRFFLEMDFFDENDETAPRLRHAYYQYGNLLGGRTWTLLTELRQLPLLLDFAAGDSILGGRTEQLRWTVDREGNGLDWAVSIENFDDEEIYNPQNLPGEARSNFPRVAGGISKPWDGGVLSLGAAISEVRWDGSGEVDDSTQTAYTLTTAGRLYIGSGNRNYVGAGVSYASGSVTDIITFANGSLPDASLNKSGDLDLARGWNGQLGLHWNWTQAWSSNFSVAYARLTDVPDTFDPDFIRAGGSVHANVIYKYDERITAGLEFMHGTRENVSGRDGDAQRMQFSLIYYF